jgi:hypothetical protein
VAIFLAVWRGLYNANPSAAGYEEWTAHELFCNAPGAQDDAVALAGERGLPS